MNFAIVALCGLLMLSAGGAAGRTVSPGEMAPFVPMSPEEESPFIPWCGPGEEPTGPVSAAVLGRLEETPSVDTLTKALRHESPVVRYAACEALSALGPEGASAVPELRRLIRDQSGPLRIRLAAMETLGEIGPEAEPGLPDLRAIIKKNKGRNSYAQSILSSVARATVVRVTRSHARVRKLIESLSETRPRSARDEALRVLQMSGEAASEAVPGLIKLIEKEEDPGLRLMAVVAIERIGSNPDAAVPALLRLLREGPPENQAERAVYHRAIRATAAFVSRDQGALQFALETFNNGTLVERGLLIRGLREHSVESPEIYRGLQRVLASAGERLREDVIWYLAEAQRPPADFVGAALRSLEAEESESFFASESAVEYLSSVARPPEASDQAVSAILKVAKSGSRCERWLATMALAELAPFVEPEQAVGVLVSRLDDSAYSVIRASTEALKAYGAKAAPALPKLKAWREGYPGSLYERWDELTGLEPLPDLIAVTREAIGQATVPAGQTASDATPGFRDG